MVIPDELEATDEEEEWEVELEVGGVKIARPLFAIVDKEENEDDVFGLVRRCL